MTDYSLSTSDLVAYGILLGVTVKILLTENKDVTCPYLSAGSEECERRGGMPFSDTHPELSDTPKILKDKVAKALSHESSASSGGGSYVLSTAIMAGVTVLVFQKAIPWRKFLPRSDYYLLFTIWLLQLEFFSRIRRSRKAWEKFAR